MRRVVFRELLAILRDLHGLSERQERALSSRIKHLQSLEIPTEGGVGKGQVATYGLEDILKLALAFELLEVGMASADAARIILAEWPPVLGAIVRGSSAGGEAQFLLLRPRALADVGAVPGRPPSEWGVCTLLSRKSLASAYGPDRPGPTIVIDLAAFRKSVRQATLRLPEIGGADWELALATLS